MGLGEGERASQEEGPRPLEVGLERAGLELRRGHWRRECIKLPEKVKSGAKGWHLNSDT